jgi:choline dehydrogenase
VLAVAAKHRLTIEYDSLATRVLLDADKRAVGIEYLKCASLYRASPLASGGVGVLRSAKAQRELILCCGAFNTPQLLMLSGIGPPDALAAAGVATQVALEGVGRNLQDRYELGVVHKKPAPWACLQGARFEPGDPLYDQWRAGGGMYVSNGAAVAFTARSSPKQAIPDLFMMALLTRFTGYFPGYSKVIRDSRDDLTFTVLKARTQNRGGIVTLASCDPRDAPRIDFNYFEDGTDRAGEDLDAVVEGVALVRRLAAKLQARGAIGAEDTPGSAFHGAALRQYVREHAWGHHACGTCAIGPREAGGVLTSDFRVHGTTGLRVVDASVFPRIPGFFIACAVYMIGEKAAEVILSHPQGPAVGDA